MLFGTRKRNPWQNQTQNVEPSASSGQGGMGEMGERTGGR